MRLLLILILLGVLGVAAFITKPDEAAQKQHVDGIFDARRREHAQSLDIGKLISGGLVDVIRMGKFEDKLVYSKYTVSVEDKPLITCWGAFSNFYCTDLAGDPDAGAKAKPGAT